MAEQKNVPNFGTNTGDMLSQIEEIFEERNKVYEKREMLLNEKAEDLKKEQKELDCAETELKLQRQKSEEERKEIERERETLRVLKESVAEKEKDLAKKTETLVMEKIRIEKLKNEILNARTENEQTFREYSGNENGELSDYIPVSELENYVSIEKYEALQNEFSQEIETWREERNGLLKQILDLESKVKCTENFQTESNDMENETIEELNAQVVRSYMEKNGLTFTNLEIHHSEGKDQLYAEKGNLTYYFIFDAPCYFDVSTNRKDSRKLQNALAQLNQEHPDTKFFYRDGMATATSYFSVAMPAYELIENVESVSQFFVQ